MWNRSGLKDRAKAAIRKNYWAAVIVAFIMVLVSASSNADDAAKNTARQSSEAGYSAEENKTLSEQPEETPLDKTVEGVKKNNGLQCFQCYLDRLRPGGLVHPYYIPAFIRSSYRKCSYGRRNEVFY